MSNENLPTFDAARAAALAEDPGDDLFLEHKGIRYIIRPPTVAAARKAARDSTRMEPDPQNPTKKVARVDEAAQALRVVMASVFVDAVEDGKAGLRPVFTPHDLDTLVNGHYGPNTLLAKVLNLRAERARAVTVETAMGNSEASRGA